MFENMFEKALNKKKSRQWSITEKKGSIEMFYAQ